MSQVLRSLNNAIGRKIFQDIYSFKGVLLVAASTTLTREHISVLEKHNVSLTPYLFMNTYDEKGFVESQKLVDQTVVQMAELFNQVREKKKVPLAELRNDVIPIIQEVSQSASLFGLIATLQAKDDYTYRHNIAVGSIASLIGSWMGLNHQEHLQLTTAALLHDIGKMLIPSEILNKPDQLTEEEYTVMKSHTLLGYDILKNTVGITHRQALVALQHHERMDGSGYPFGSVQDKIDLFSRIVSVADIFHAMTSQRVYRDPSPFYEVLSQMEQDMFGSLDPVITRLFIRKVMQTLIGRMVLLTDGTEGTIRLIHTHDPTRPMVQIENNLKDLSIDRSLKIIQIL